MPDVCMKERLLREADLTLDKAVAVCRAAARNMNSAARYFGPADKQGYGHSGENRGRQIYRKLK